MKVRYLFDSMIGSDRGRLWMGLISSVAATWIVVVAAGAATPGELKPAAKLQVAFERGLLSVDARDAPLAEVLDAIGAEAEIDVTISRNLDARVTQYFTAVPLAEGIRRLLRNHSMALIYSPSARKSKFHALTAVLVIDSIPAEQAAGKLIKPVAPIQSKDRADRLKAIRAAALRRDASVTSELIQFAQDPDPLVRNEATAALGQRGGKEVVDALIAALGDQLASVRIQALRGLRRIQSAVSTPTLSEVLRQDPDPRVRRTAAQLLAGLGSEEARAALEAAAGDADDSVRQAIATSLQAWHDRDR